MCLIIYGIENNVEILYIHGIYNMASTMYLNVSEAYQQRTKHIVIKIQLGLLLKLLV